MESTQSRRRDKSNWDSNYWKWNGDSFRATQMNPAPLDLSMQFFPVGPVNPVNVGYLEAPPPCHLEESAPVHGNEKQKRILVDADEAEPDDDVRSLSLKLGGPLYSVNSGEAKSVKKTKCVELTRSSPVCLVEGCKADLTKTKDYHRKHKVCGVHSKASAVLVGGVMQRFCQQCSRFQVIPEFDEGKRSCRKRLEGHNKRRRKTHPEPVANAEPALGERDSNHLLITLLRILANMQGSPTDQSRDQDFFSQLLRNFAGMSTEQNIVTLLQHLKNEGTTSIGPSQIPPLAPSVPDIAIDSSSNPIMENHPNIQDPNMESAFERKGLVDIDLNNAYDDDTQDCAEEDLQLSHDPNLANGCVDTPKLGERDPQKAYWNGSTSDSRRSTPTSSSSSGEGQGQGQSDTHRILIKLFEKEPQDIPSDLRGQIILWLHSRPTDVESYIRPGCIILTIYLRLEKSMWEELCNDLGSALRRLLGSSIDSFWRKGWICTRIRHSVAIAYNGEVVLDRSLPSRNHENCSITLVKPIAVPASKSAEFSVEGFNLLGSASRLLCNLQGKCIAEQSCHDLIDGDSSEDGKDNQLQNLSFHCSIPEVTGRGFIEVEGDVLSSSFFPFIVAEDEVCSEIQTLENAIEDEEESLKNEAMNFIHEMGWLLQRSRANIHLGLFPFKRFKWLIEFAVENDWCAVVKKLLRILFDGAVDTVEHDSADRAALDLGLLHRAVRRNCRGMVEFLLEYVPEESSSSVQPKKCFIFKPDAAGPSGWTPLHIAANEAGSEQVLDALTNDPDSIGLKTWNTAQDDMGLTPKDYACLQHHYSYINLVQTKINGRKKPYPQQLILDIILPPVLEVTETKPAPATLETAKIQCGSVQGGQCKLCEKRRLPYGKKPRTCLSYKPAVVSVLSVAALCVCVALLFRGSPEVVYIFRPFRWELVKFGAV